MAVIHKFSLSGGFNVLLDRRRGTAVHKDDDDLVDDTAVNGGDNARVYPETIMFNADVSNEALIVVDATNYDSAFLASTDVIS